METKVQNIMDAAMALGGIAYFVTGAIYIASKVFTTYNFITEPLM